MTDNRPFSGSVLKWIAIAAMFLDHIGASLLEGFVLNAWGTSPLGYQLADWDFWYPVDLPLRYAGRIAFPIFCFLLVEGAVHTRNAKKYLLRLAVFAVLSEIPFDLAFRNQPFFWGHQNVFLTLVLGLLAVLAFRRWPEEGWKGAAALAALGAAAELLRTDYGAVGVAVIAAMYLLRKRRLLACLVSLGLLLVLAGNEIFCIPGLLAILLYNGKRGRQPKYFFYVFYPAHLLLFWAAGNYLLPGIGQLTAFAVFS